MSKFQKPDSTKLWEGVSLGVDERYEEKLPVGGHFSEPHLEEDIPELVANLVHYPSCVESVMITQRSWVYSPGGYRQGCKAPLGVCAPRAAKL